MDDRTRKSQIDKAWMIHDLAQGRIPKEVWRKVRTFKRTIAPIADRLEDATQDRDRIKQLLYDHECKGAVGRARALAKLRKHLDLAHISFPRQGIMWSWLAPRGCMLVNPETEGEAQDAILVRYGFAWIQRRRELNGYEAFSIEVPDHATARLVQRFSDVNLPRVLMEAQDQFFAADAALVGRHVVQGMPLYLRAGPGLLICRAIDGRTPSGITYSFAQARTWISDSMIRPDQTPIAPAEGDAHSQLTLMSALVLRGPVPKDDAA
jgi:hypothetical protein